MTLFTLRPTRYVAALGLCMTLPLTVVASDGEGLAALMASMQVHSHKLQLALDNDNLALADFYAHELEEVLEDVQAVDAYHGKPVGALTTSMLLPAFGALEDAIDSGVVESANSAFDTMVSACNSCHVATGYDVIHIQRNTINPYMQSFTVDP